MGIRDLLNGVRGWFRRSGTAWRNPSLPADDSAPAEAAESGRTSRLRWTGSRQHAMEQLQAGYQRMLALCQTIDDHLQSQRQQGQQVTESLAHLTSSIGEVPGLLDQLSQRLERIAEQVVRASAGSERLSESIDQLIPAQRSQNDLLSSVHRQLGESAHTNSQLSDVLVELKSAMQGLSRSETERMKVFEQLADMLGTRDREFTAMLQQQNKASRWVYAISLAAAAVVVVVAIFAMVR
jgi:methyl-accepting chemotaxis protein